LCEMVPAHAGTPTFKMGIREGEFLLGMVEVEIRDRDCKVKLLNRDYYA